MKRIVVSVSGVGADEKAKLLEESFRKIIQEYGIRSAIVQVEDTKELKIPQFVNDPYNIERRRGIG